MGIGRVMSESDRAGGPRIDAPEAVQGTGTPESGREQPLASGWSAHSGRPTGSLHAPTTRT